MLDYQASKCEVSRIVKIHVGIVDFLREVDSEFHEIAARNLALRVEHNVLQPVRYALSILETIEDVGQEYIPDIILEKWDLAILHALEFGGVNFE